MSFVDWHTGASSDVLSSSSYMCMSTVDDLSYTPSAEERSRDAAQIVATGRRSWKTLKGKGEAVWPPNLEAALIEALEKYEPDSSKSNVNKTLGRFPMRNRFISDYIYDKTGKRRTPKQVGSRLQQLRDTCKGKRILSLISRRSRSPQGDSDLDSVTTSPSGNSEISLPASSPRAKHLSSNHLSSSPRRQRNTSIDIDILPGCSPWPSTMPIINLRPGISSSARIHLSVSHQDVHTQCKDALSTPSEPHPFQFSPAITIASPSELCLHMDSTVYVDGSDTAAHSEVVQLEQSTTIDGSGLLYKTYLIPNYWSTLLGSGDSSRFIIRQKIVTDEKDNKARREIAITYRFVSSSPTPRFSCRGIQPASVTTWPMLQTTYSHSSLLIPTTHETHDADECSGTQNPDLQYSLNDNRGFAPYYPETAGFPEQDGAQVWQSYPTHYGVESLDSVFTDGRGHYLEQPISTEYWASAPQTLAAAVVIPENSQISWLGSQSFLPSKISQHVHLTHDNYARPRF